MCDLFVMLQQRYEDFSSEILILSFCVYVFTLYLFLLCLFSYSGLILVLTRSLVYSYCQSRCGRLSNYSLSKGRLLYSFMFVHFFLFCRSQATFILGESSEMILLFVDSGGIEVVLRKFFLVPESGNRDILLLFFSCTNKRTCGDMKDRQTSDLCVHERVIRQLLRLPRSCMRVAKGTQLQLMVYVCWLFISEHS